MLVRPPLGELRQIIDHLLAVGVEDVRAVFVVQDARLVRLVIGIAADVRRAGRSAGRARHAGWPAARQGRSRQSRLRRSDNRSGACTLALMTRSFRSHQQRRASVRQSRSRAGRQSGRPCAPGSCPSWSPTASGRLRPASRFRDCATSSSACSHAATNSSGVEAILHAFELAVVANHVLDRGRHHRLAAGEIFRRLGRRDELRSIRSSRTASARRPSPTDKPAARS